MSINLDYNIIGITLYLPPPPPPLPFFPLSLSLPLSLLPPFRILSLPLYNSSSFVPSLPLRLSYYHYINNHHYTSPYLFTQVSSTAFDRLVLISSSCLDRGGGLYMEHVELSKLAMVTETGKWSPPKYI